MPRCRLWLRNYGHSERQSRLQRQSESALLLRKGDGEEITEEVAGGSLLAPAPPEGGGAW